MSGRKAPARRNLTPSFTLTPESSAAMSFDLGDLDAVAAADWEIRLPLYTGNTILLRSLLRSR